MPITPKDWRDEPDLTTPIDAAALEDLESRVGNYLEQKVNAKGDILAASGDNALARVAVGTTDQVLTADPTQTTGVKWATPAAGGGGVTVQEEGVSLTQRANLNFVGNSITAVDNAGTSATDVTVRVQAERQRSLWLPTGAIGENFLAVNAGASALPTSGRLRVGGGGVLQAGVPISSVTFAAGPGSMAGGSHAWAAMIRKSDLAVLAKSADDTGAVSWPAGSPKTFSFTAGTGAYTPTAEEAVYFGVVVVATTMPSVTSTTQNSGATAIEHGTGRPLGADSTTGLTDPASLGATAATLVSVNPVIYCYWS